MLVVVVVVMAERTMTKTMIISQVEAWVQPQGSPYGICGR
jgi:hypothetical protein